MKNATKVAIPHSRIPAPPDKRGIDIRKTLVTPTIVHSRNERFIEKIENIKKYLQAIKKTSAVLKHKTKNLLLCFLEKIETGIKNKNKNKEPKEFLKKAFETNTEKMIKRLASMVVSTSSTTINVDVE